MAGLTVLYGRVYPGCRGVYISGCRGVYIPRVVGEASIPTYVREASIPTMVGEAGYTPW